MKNNILNFIKLVISTTALILSLSVNAVIISGTYTTAGGKVVALQGLDWLSLDETRNLSRNSVQAEIDSGSSYLFSSSDWRYATREEVSILLGSLWGGTTQKWSLNNGDGSQWFDDNFGLLAYDTLNSSDVWVQNQKASTYDYSFALYGSSAECGAVAQICRALVQDMDFYMSGSDYNYNGWFSGNYGLYAKSTDPFLVSNSWSAGQSGSFLVRSGISPVTVTEPSIAALLSFGLLGLGLFRRKMKK